MTWRSARDLQTRQQRVRTALLAALAGLSDEEAAQRPAPDIWSIHEILAHLVLTERRMVEEMQLMLREDQPELPSIRELSVSGHLDAIIQQAGAIADLIVAFDAACQATLDLVAQLDEEQELRGGHSPELGHVLTAQHAILNVSYHYLGHVEQICAARRQLGLGNVVLADLAGLVSGFPG